MRPKCDIILKSNVEVRSCTLVTGFHGIGGVGFLTTKYLADELKAERIGFIKTRYLPPYVFLENKVLKFPYEIYKSDNLVFIIYNVQLELKDMYEVVKAIVEWTIANNFNKAILFGGLDIRFRKKNDIYKYRIVPTSAYARELQKIDDKLFLEDKLYVVGPLALLLAYYELEDFPAVAVLPYAYPNKNDYIAVATAVDVFNEMTGIKVNTEKLIKLAEREQKIERELSELVRKYEKTLEVKDKDKLLYV